jgi:translation elongation factor EF-1beta
VIAKSNVILDVKPWDDETDMKAMEAKVRTIAMEGLVWGVCKSYCVWFLVTMISLTYYVVVIFSQIGSPRVRYL